MSIRLGVALVHWPVFDRHRKVVATNITNLDVHDIARVSRVYGVESYYLVHPMQEQLMFVSRLLDHWRIGDGKRFNPMRATALTMVKTVPSVAEAIQNFDPDAIVIGTTARQIENVERVSFQDLRAFLENRELPKRLRGAGTTAGAAGESHEQGADEANESARLRIWEKLKGRRSLILVFGTGFGMTEDLLKGCDLLLEPMRGAPPLDYRHLSVRSAVSICLDRLLGAW